jgi:hypothetical protein
MGLLIVEVLVDGLSDVLICYLPKVFLYKTMPIVQLLTTHAQTLDKRDEWIY